MLFCCLVFFANADHLRGQNRTDASQPRGFKFSNGFAISQNPNPYLNKQETLSLIDKIFKLYVETPGKELKLQPVQKALLIWDVFKGQKTNKVLLDLATVNINVVSVPANVTHFFHPLDLTVNGETKCFLKDMSTTWYSTEVQKQMESGNNDEIEVDLRLSVLKPLHAIWLVSLYNHLKGSVGKRHIAKGWSKAGISAPVQGKTT